MPTEYSPESWRHIKDLFSEALTLSPEERDVFLNKATQDEQIRDRVKSLLEAYDGPDTLQSPIEPRFVDSLLGDLISYDTPDGHVGPWKLTEEIGRGGMGIVYIADRIDGEYEQRVALKLVKQSVASEAIIESFRNERQVLASLEHSFIARLVDGGVTSEGQPWFAMEYVEGKNITDYCFTNALSLDARLKLFIKICTAVEHAHNQLVVHRDLKPSNILVTDTGDPKLLDFGVSQVLEESVGSLSEGPHSRRWMTLEYASPELITGDPVGTASDTYQLGLILFEMLTGRKAYDLNGLSRTEAEIIITSANPEKPSSVVSGGVQPGHLFMRPDRLKRKLKGDLDAILTKSLNKNSLLRYPSAEALRTDIERYLEKLPITARPNDIGYVVGKFAARRWPGVLGVTTILVSLLAGLLIAKSGLDRAQEENDKLQLVTTYLVGIFEASDPSVAQGDSITVRELLENGIAQADALNSEPEQQAMLLGVLAKIYFNLGDLGRAEDLYRRSLEVWTEEVANPNREAAYVGAVHELAQVLVQKDQFAEARGLFESVISERSIAGESKYLSALFGLYTVHHSLGDPESSENARRVWQTAFSRASESPDAETAARMLELGQTLGWTGQMNQDKVALHEGRDLIRSSIDVLVATRGRKHPRTAAAMNELVLLLLEESSFQEQDSTLLSIVDSLSQDAVELHQAIYPEPNLYVHRALLNRARALRNSNRFDEAERFAANALDVVEQVMGKDNTAWTSTLTEYGLVELAKGDFEDAATLFRECRTAMIRQFGPGYFFVHTTTVYLSRALIGMGRYSEAEDELLMVFHTVDANRGRSDSFTQWTIRSLVGLYEAWGRSTQAEEYRVMLIAAGNGK